MAFGFLNFIRSESWEIDPHNMELGQSFLGTQQIVATLADQWTAKIHVTIKTAELSALRAWRTKRRGRLVVDPIGPTREWAGSADGTIFGTEVLHSDGTAHSDGAGYSQGYLAFAAIVVRSTRMTVTALGVTDEFNAGRFFAIGGRLYEITSLGGIAGDEVTFDFWPPLRAAVSADDVFDWPPRTSMRLTADDDGTITDTPTGTIDISFSLEEVL